MDLRDGKNSFGLVAVLALICIVVQIAVSPNLGPLSGLANMALIFTCCIAMSEGGANGIVAGFVSGLVYDLCAGSPLGLMSLELTVLAYVLGTSGRNRFVEGWTETLQTFALSAACVFFFYHLALLIFGMGGSLVDTLVFRFLPELLFNCVLFLPFAQWYIRQLVAGSSLGFGARSKARRGRFDTPGF